MSKQLASNVISAFNLQAALISPIYADSFGSILDTLRSANATEEKKNSESANSELLASYHIESTNEKSFAFADGVAFIPISGLLINRFNHSWGGWVTGYNFIRTQLKMAITDPDVKGIVFDVNSGGGQVAGCFELADEIYASRTVKPSVAIIDSSCYSAAYALASSASKMIITPSGGAGSIGVVAMHMDYSKAYEDYGVKVTYIYSGDHKVDGNPYQALPADVKANIQKSVDATRQTFVDTIARNRSMESQAVFDTQAQSYSAEEALSLGLVDEILAPNQAFISFFNELSSSDNVRESFMTTQNKTLEASGSTQADAQTTETVAEVSASSQAEVAETKGDSRAEERARIAGITTCAEASDKAKLANHLAFNTDLSVEAAKAILASASAEVTASASVTSGKSPLDTAMDATANPNIGADTDSNASLSRAQEILAAQTKATGSK